MNDDACKGCYYYGPLDERGYCADCSPNGGDANGEALLALIEVFGRGITQAAEDWRAGRRARKEREKKP